MKLSFISFLQIKTASSFLKKLSAMEVVFRNRILPIWLRFCSPLMGIVLISWALFGQAKPEIIEVEEKVETPLFPPAGPGQKPSENSPIPKDARKDRSGTKQQPDRGNAEVPEHPKADPEPTESVIAAPKVHIETSGECSPGVMSGGEIKCQISN